MDPVLKTYMFYHWIEDNNEKVELFKHHGYLIGSFTNPEAVNKIMGGNTLSSSEEAFDETTRMVAETIKKNQEASQQASKKRRRRKKVS